MVRLYVLALIAALAACRPSPAATTPSGANVDDRLAAIEVELAKLTSGGPTPEARLARVEERLDKIVNVLRQAVEPELDRQTTYAIPVDASDPVIGPVDAKVTIVEAYEFLCPYCARIAPTIDELAARYPKDLRVVSKYYVIHGPPAEPSGRAACAAAKQGKYLAMKKALWSGIWPNGGGPDNERATDVGVKAIAKQTGLDVKRFERDLAGEDCKGWLMRSSEVLNQFGARGTPAFYVNGRFIGSGKSLAELITLVDAEIGKVNAAVANGVRAGKYYDDVVLKDGAAAAKMVTPFD